MYDERVTAEVSTSSDAQVAWAAGIFEGEGCVYVLRRRGRADRVVLAVAMTDLDVIERLRDVFGCGSISSERRRDGRKPIYRWNTSARGDVERVLALITPWLMSRRQARIAEAVAEVERDRQGVAPRGTREACYRGHLRAEHSYKSSRGNWVCRLCAQIHSKARYAAQKG